MDKIVFCSCSKKASPEPTLCLFVPTYFIPSWIILRKIPGIILLFKYCVI